jgi:hypothetical protein
MANRDIIARISGILDMYEAGQIGPLDVEEMLPRHMEALEALPHARVHEAHALCVRLLDAHMSVGDEDFIVGEPVTTVVAEFRRFLGSLPAGGTG